MVDGEGWGQEGNGEGRVPGENMSRMHRSKPMEHTGTPTAVRSGRSDRPKRPSGCRVCAHTTCRASRTASQICRTEGRTQSAVAGVNVGPGGGRT